MPDGSVIACDVVSAAVVRAELRAAIVGNGPLFTVPDADTVSGPGSVTIRSFDGPPPPPMIV